jgi:hypothetical protein
MATATATSELPWWVEHANERCPACLQVYAYEVQVRCVDCDGPLCPLCAVEVRLELLQHRCPDCCHPGGEA